MKALLLLQRAAIASGIALLAGIPLATWTVGIPSAVKGMLFTVSFVAVSLVMCVRPLADIFSEQLWLRRLVFLRKGFGILSASIIVGIMIASGLPYLQSVFTVRYYSLDRYALLAHLGDLSGLILLATSNNFSQRHLGRNWKRIQRLSYVYFYAGGLYEYLMFDSLFALYMVLLVTNLTVFAWAIKAWRRAHQQAA